MLIIFIHISEHTTNKFKCNLIPQGVFAISDHLYNHGINVQIIHKELEEYLDNSFNLYDYLVKLNPDFICFDLNYHFQLYSVINVAQEIKKHLPNTPIVLGGLTATIFAADILAFASWIDYIIAGDGTTPLLDLANNKNVESIPNLYYRKKSEISKNEADFKITQDILNSLSFANLKLLKNYPKYLQMKLSSNTFHSTKQSYYSIGIGCYKNCSFCGGTNLINNEFFNRCYPLLKTANSVIADLKELQKYGITRWCNGLDLNPSLEYYSELYSGIKKEGLHFTYIYECFTLPQKEHVELIANTFNKDSIIILSPYSGAQKIRTSNRIGLYSNTELLTACKNILDNNLYCSVYFSAGFSNETPQDVEETIELIHRIKAIDKKIRIYAQIIELEPASHYITHSKDDNINPQAVSFKDYYSLHKEGKEIGYDTKYFSFQEIKQIIENYNNAILS